MLFSYIALNAENQKLKGVINADDESGAKSKLHRVGLSVISLVPADKNDVSSLSVVEQTQQAVSKKKLPGFEFFVIDAHGKNLSGTIEAKDRKNAFLRLFQEYKFDVISLCEMTTPEDLRFEEGKKGLKEIAEDLEVEFGVSVKKGDKKKEGEELFDKAFLMERKELLKEVEEVSTKTREILLKYKDAFPSDVYEEVEQLMGDLMRLRFSNNLPLLRKIIEDLFGKIEEVMQKYVIPQNKGEGIEEYKGLLEMEDEIGGGGKAAQKGVLRRLRGISGSLDIFLGKKPKKKFQLPDEIPLWKEEIIMMRIFFRQFFQASFTKNKTLRQTRFSELKKQWEEWNRRKELRLRKEREEILKNGQRVLNSLENDDMTGKEQEVIFFLFQEFQVFLGTLLYIIFIFLAILSAFPQFFPENWKLISSSPSFLIFLFCVFWGFFSLSMREKFFLFSLPESAFFLGVMGFVGFVYLINL